MNIITSLKPADWACAVGGVAIGKAMAGNTEWSATCALMSSGAYLGLTASRKFFQTKGTSKARQLLLTTSCLVTSYLAARKSFVVLSEISSPMAYIGGLTTLLASMILTKYICKNPLTTLSSSQTLVGRWVVNKREVRVLRIGEELNLEVIENGVSRRGPLETDGRSLEEQIEYLRTCEAVEEEDGSYSFKKPDFFSPRYDRPWLNFQMCTQDHHECYGVFRRERDFVYQVYYRDGRLNGERRAIQIPISNVLVNGSRKDLDFDEAGFLGDLPESHKYIDLFDKLRNGEPCPADLISRYIQNLHIRSVVKIKDLRITGTKERKIFIHDIARKIAAKLQQENPFFVVVAPIVECSIFRKTVPLRLMFSIGGINIHICPDRWGITLVCASGSRSDSDCNSGNHAEIIIEGMEDGEYFMYVSHLKLDKSRRSQEVEIGPIDPSKLKYSGRSEVWLVEAEKVREMIIAIKEDRKNPPILNPLGSDSFFSKEGQESCFTWARKKLKIINIHLGYSYIGWLATITSNFTPYKGNV